MAYGRRPTPSMRRHRRAFARNRTPRATCTGAIAGGSTNPASSLCVITRAPSNLVETPHEVAHTKSLLASLVW